MGARFWLKTALAAASAALFAVTLLWHNWIEILFRLDPDHGGGALEWLLVAVSFVLTVTLSVSARLEWRRSVTLAQAG